MEIKCIGCNTQIFSFSLDEDDPKSRVLQFLCPNCGHTIEIQIGPYGNEVKVEMID